MFRGRWNRKTELILTRHRTFETYTSLGFQVSSSNVKENGFSTCGLKGSLFLLSFWFILYDYRQRTRTFGSVVTSEVLVSVTSSYRPSWDRVTGGSKVSGTKRVNILFNQNFDVVRESCHGICSYDTSTIDNKMRCTSCTSRSPKLIRC